MRGRVRMKADLSWLGEQAVLLEVDVLCLAWVGPNIDFIAHPRVLRNLQGGPWSIQGCLGGILVSNIQSRF